MKESRTQKSNKKKADEATKDKDESHGSVPSLLDQDFFAADPARKFISMVLDLCNDGCSRFDQSIRCV